MSKRTLECCICGKEFNVPLPKEDHFYDWAWKKIPNCIGYYFPCPECKEIYCQECIDAVDTISNCSDCEYQKEHKKEHEE